MLKALDNLRSHGEAKEQPETQPEKSAKQVKRAGAAKEPGLAKRTSQECGVRVRRTRKEASSIAPIAEETPSA